ncbi:MULTISPECIES: hypothetical protein [unclassified Nocardiopsis]|uniref:hypothetical protein n=1 Tax=Nocardiopsis TaxID=2013 RepID=UPI00387B0DFA
MSWKDRLSDAATTARKAASDVGEGAKGGLDAVTSGEAAERAAAAARKAGEQGSAAARAASDRSAEMAARARDQAQQIQAALRESTWVTDTLDSWEVPAAPLTEPFRLSVGGIIERAWTVPRGVGRMLRLLDRLGAIEVGPDTVGFNGETVPWAKVKEIRARRTTDILLTSGVESVTDLVSGALPPLPGRSWLADKAADVLLALALSTVSTIESHSGKEEMDAFDEAADEAGFGALPCEITYGRRFWRTGEVGSGFGAALFMAVRPDIRDLVRHSAELQGRPVALAPYDERLTSIAERAERLAQLRGRLLSKGKEAPAALEAGDGDAG